MADQNRVANAISEIQAAFHDDDAPRVRALLNEFPSLSALVNEPIGPFDAPAIVCARSREMLDVLLDAGADINARSRWWAGGFGLLDNASPELAEYAIERGAVVNIHAAARLGMIDRLRELIRQDPLLVHARGGDGQTPLHCASTVEIASHLLEHGADIDARDIDHESTPAQYMLDHRHEVARYLVARGCQTDLLMAAALGDPELLRRHLQTDPRCIAMRVNSDWFPMRDPRAGGTIYQWNVGFHATAHQIASRSGRTDLLELLFERSPAGLALVEACWIEDEPRLKAILATHPEIVVSLTEEEHRQLAEAARNNATGAVRLMLKAGLPVEARGQHHATPLHWAAFHGNTTMTSEILCHQPPLETTDRDFNSTPLGWAMHGSEHGWHRDSGDYPGTVQALLLAGAQPPTKVAGSLAVQEVLRRHAAGRS